MQAKRLFHGALGECRATAGLRADQQRQRIEGRVASDSDGGFQLGETAFHGFRRISRKQRRMLLTVGDVRLIRRRAARAHFLHRHHHLDDIQAVHHLRQLGRGQPTKEPKNFVARNIEVGQRARQSQRIRRHARLGDRRIDGIVRDESIKQVKLAFRPAVQLDNPALSHLDLRLRIVRAFKQDQPFLGPLVNEAVLVDLALGACLETFGGKHRFLQEPRMNANRRQ